MMRLAILVALALAVAAWTHGASTAPSFVLLEGGGKVTLEDGSGSILLEH